jgi:hypothetical protein
MTEAAFDFMVAPVLGATNKYKVGMPVSEQLSSAKPPNPSNLQMLYLAHVATDVPANPLTLNAPLGAEESVSAGEIEGSDNT